MRKVLIADDSVLNRAVLRKILEKEYEVLEAADGVEAMRLIHLNTKTLSAVLLDIVMPGMDGYAVLGSIGSSSALAGIPVIVCAGSEDTEIMERAYALGAAGFLTKPYNRALVLSTLHNIIRLCEMSSVKDTVMSDRLTGLLTGEAFFEKSAELVAGSPPYSYVIESMDIDNFKIINNLYGIEEGNFLLRHIADAIKRMCNHIGGICGHIFADNFVILYPNNPDADEYVSLCRDSLRDVAELQGNISVSAGRYVIGDSGLSINAMYDLATIAKHSVKGKYDSHLAYFDQSMLHSMLQSQLITGDMNKALANRQFEVWYQPQVNHSSGRLMGAEALVRWRHPERGLVSPGVFIPVFEQNGFIYELDKYVWESVCVMLRNWLDRGIEPLPVSVNISRYEILKDDFLDVIVGLVSRYRIPADLLRLEITESTFAKSTDRIVGVVNTLKEKGFIIEIDDFGSGYSSLNTLKSVPADVIKLDMRFLSDSGDSKRGGSIIESVVRMVKWLGMTVIAEGVEKKEHADFLKTVGCLIVQGYLYAKPMPADEYERYFLSAEKEEFSVALGTVDNLDSNAFWNPESMETLIFNSYVGGACIIEYYNGNTEPLRINERFIQEFGGAEKNGVPVSELSPAECMDAENLRIMYDNLDNAVNSGKESACEVCVTGVDSAEGPVLYLRCTARLIAWTGERRLLYCVINNITAQRAAENKERNIQIELLDNLPCGAALYEYDGKKITTMHINRQYWTFTDRQPVSCDSIDAVAAVHPDDVKQILPEISDAILQHRDAVFDMRIKYGLNGYRKFHAVGKIVPGSGNKYLIYAIYIPASEDTALLEEQNKGRRDRDRLEFIFRNAAISVWSYNLRTKVITQNERSRRLHGFENTVTGVPESLVESGFIHPDSVAGYLEMYRRLQDGEREAEGVFRVKTADRSGYWYEHIKYAAVSDGNDRPDVIFGISSDVSAEYEQDNAIRQWMTLISDMQVENNAICEFDLTRNIFVRKQGTLFQPFEFAEDDGFDTYIQHWADSNVYKEDEGRVTAFLNRDKLLSMHGRGILDGGLDYRAKIRDDIKWCSVSIKFIRYPADDAVRVIMVHTDINLRKEDELRLIEENRHDHLTGALNRKAFEAQTNAVIAESPSSVHALLMIDIDNFKKINDVLGHVTGDNVLKKTVNGLHSLLRQDDLVGRIGGDEFMVFMKGVPDKNAVSRRSQMILDMMNTVLNDGVQLSCSIGIALSPADGTSFGELYRNADKAAYYSKQNGKNSFTYFDDEMISGNPCYETESMTETEREKAMKAWDERTKRVMEENLRLLKRQEEDERYRMVIESTHIITFEWNAVSGKFSASADFYGYVLSEQPGENLFSENVDVTGIHPDDRALFYGKFLEKVLSGESAPETSLRLSLKNGGYRWCRLGALVFFDKSEILKKAIGIITEENVQKKQTDIQLDAITKFMSAGVLILEIRNTGIQTLFISESYFRLENTGAVTGSDTDVLSAVHPDDVKRVRRKLIICSASGAVMEETFRVLHGDSVYWRHMHAVRIPYADTANPVMIAVETDITDVKQREEKLERQQELISTVFGKLDIVSWVYYPGERKAVFYGKSGNLSGEDITVNNMPYSPVEDGTVLSEDGEAFRNLHDRLDGTADSASAVIRLKRNGLYVPRKIIYTRLPGERPAYGAISIAEESGYTD